MQRARHGLLSSLAAGQVAADLAFPYPQLSEEQRQTTYGIIDALRHSGGDLHGLTERERSLLWARLQELGGLGTSLPTAQGGLGLGTLAWARLIEALSRIDLALALRVIAHEALGARAVLAFGSEPLKQRLLPDLARGVRRAAFALTEQVSGSDPSASATLAVYDEPAGNFRLNGHKKWVAGADDADVFVVFGATHLPGEGKKPRMNALLVEREPNVAVKPPHDTLGTPGLHVCEVRFHDLRIPADHLLGAAGKGFRVAASMLSLARVVLSAAYVGQCKLLTNTAITRLKKRRSSGRTIGEYPLLKRAAAEMMRDTYAAESMSYLAAGVVDRLPGEVSLEAMATRIACSELLWRTAQRAAQIAGGEAYLRDNPAGRALQDARIAFSFDGTNEVLRCTLAMGAVRAELRRPPATGIAERGVQRVKTRLLRRARGVLKLSAFHSVHPALAPEAALAERLSLQASDACLEQIHRHGKDLSELQMTQARVADVLIEQLKLTAVLSRCSAALFRHGEAGAGRDVEVTRLVLQDAEERLLSTIEALRSDREEMYQRVAARAYADGGYPFDLL
ncbi:MAG TPA: acyl-CoA dehydrogenase family protein [Polyangiaceae bacterium]|nr:acyl-CoA dehydrogenase family protein [Polyangiaceae bacterium]